MDKPMPAFKITSYEGATRAVEERSASYIISVDGCIEQKILEGSGIKNLGVLDISGIADWHEQLVASGCKKYKNEVLAAWEMVKSAWDAGQEILFHCRQGEYRSPGFAFAMLVAYLGADHMEAAWDAVKSAPEYTTIRPNVVTFIETMKALPDDVPAKSALAALKFDLKVTWKQLPIGH